MRPFFALAAFIFVATPACVRRGEPHLVYAAFQPGLTLQFENPDLDAEVRVQSRYQVFVKDARKTPEGLEVTTTTASLKGSSATIYLCLQDGGIYTFAVDKDRASVMLPPGFPYETTAWQAAGVNYRAIGRASANLSGIMLPNPIGVWVEAVPAQTLQPSSANNIKRILMMPGIGEVETRVLRHGEWVTTNRLVGLSFTDAI